MSFLTRIFGNGGQERAAYRPLYDSVVAAVRDPAWYVEGEVPDTVDGRFDMIAAVLALVMLRMESEPSGGEPAARLAERFVDDMDGQLRQIGIGDYVVGKHIGRMMSALGGRLGAFRDAGETEPLGEAVRRNVPLPKCASATSARATANAACSDSHSTRTIEATGFSSSTTRTPTATRGWSATAWAPTATARTRPPRG